MIGVMRPLFFVTGLGGIFEGPGLADAQLRKIQAEKVRRADARARRRELEDRWEALLDRLGEALRAKRLVLEGQHLGRAQVERKLDAWWTDALCRELRPAEWDTYGHARTCVDWYYKQGPGRRIAGPPR